MIDDSPGGRGLGRRELLLTSGAAVVGVGAGALIGSQLGSASSNTPSLAALPQDALAVARARGLTSDDVLAAMKTYTPTGKLDTHYLFASGGHSGQIWVIGVPSMRVLKVIPVFSHSSYQGWGYTDESKKILAAAEVNGETTTWGDTHHPALSETDGVYDANWLFINDKAGGRVAVIDLRDFMCKQIVKNPLFISDHGSTFVTPNTEYIIETSQYAMPHGWTYAPLTQDSYNNNYRGAMTFWKFDRQAGRIDVDKSWAIELPPYFQDLADAGKLASYGWAVCNSFNTERYIGGDLQGKAPMEVGASQRDMDYLHLVNWKAAEKAVQAGHADTVNGMKLIRMDMAAQMGLLYLIPEPKSPHGVDFTPNGQYFVVNGKLDPHVTIYNFAKIQSAIKSGNFTRDPYGLPIVNFNNVVEAQVEVGLGPLHTQFDNNGFAYTSLFLESAVAKWKLGGSYGANGWKLVAKQPINYNVGHLSACGGDTAKPEGNYLVALNKWSLDRFASTGPHHTVNLQLIDISHPDRMQLLADLPIPDGEPHYAQMISADKIKPLNIYPTGWNAQTWSKDPQATAAGKERIVRNGNTVDVYMTVMRSHITPDTIEVNQGDTVALHVTNIEQALNASHGLCISGFNISTVLDPGETLHITLQADKAGTYTYYCTEFCSALHLEMMGYLLVKPA